MFVLTGLPEEFEQRVFESKEDLHTFADIVMECLIDEGYTVYSIPDEDTFFYEDPIHHEMFAVFVVATN
jgi:hypothetical protein